MRKPGKWLYVLAATIGLVGSSLSVWRGCSSSMDSIRDMERVVMPGTGTVELPRGHHQVFLEAPSRVDGRTVGDTVARRVSCDFTTADGSAIVLSDTNRTESYNLGGYSGELQWELELEKPVPVTVQCTSETPGQWVIAIGEGFSVSVLMTGIVGFAGSIMIGLAIFFFAFIRRRSAPDPAPGRSAAPARGPGTPPT